MEKKVIIGRYGQEGVDSQLLITIGANESTWGQMGSVPQSVSRQHCSIEVMGNRYLLQNLNPMNVTYVNGQPVASRLVETNDVIELGQARYRLDWNVVINNLNVNENLNATSGYPPSNNRPAPQPNYNRPASPANNNPAPPFSGNQQNNTWLFVGIGAFVFIAIIIVGVFISQNSRSGLYDDISVSSYSSDDSYSDSYDDEVKVDEPSAPVEEEKPQMVTCPGCNGTGVFDFAPGDIMAPKQTCAGCNGTGVCSAETAEELIKVQQQVNGMMGGGSGGSGRSGRSISQIQYDLNKAYDMLADLERNYANCDGIVASSQYPRMIADQKERIRQLEEELRNAR